MRQYPDNPVEKYINNESECRYLYVCFSFLFLRHSILDKSSEKNEMTTWYTILDNEIGRMKDRIWNKNVTKKICC